MAGICKLYSELTGSQEVRIVGTLITGKKQQVVHLKVRKSTIGYQRDSYLGIVPQLNPEYTVIDCLRGYSPWGVSPLAVQAYRDFNPQKVTRYGETFYETSLKPAILKRFCVEGIQTDQLFLGHGSFNLAERLIHKLIEPSGMLGVGPQFNEIPSEFVATGGKYVPLPIEPVTFRYPFQELMEELASGKYSVLYLDNPNNPLGYLLPLERVLLLAKKASRYGTIVVVDEAYGDFVDDSQSAIHIVSETENLAVVRSFSKGLGLAAERVGYMFLSVPLAQLYTQLDVPFEPSLIAAMLATATLSDELFIQSIRREALRAKRAIKKVLKDVGYSILPTHPGVSILCAHKPGIDTRGEMASIGVSVEPGSVFQKANPAWDDTYCRIRVTSLEETAELCRRLRSLTVDKRGHGYHADER